MAFANIFCDLLCEFFQLRDALELSLRRHELSLIMIWKVSITNLIFFRQVGGDHSQCGMPNQQDEIRSQASDDSSTMLWKENVHTRQAEMVTTTCNKTTSVG
jgi:hypothetical protein